MLMYNANTRQVQYVIMQIINYSILVVFDIDNSVSPYKNSLHLVFFCLFFVQKQNRSTPNHVGMILKQEYFTVRGG